MKPSRPSPDRSRQERVLDGFTLVELLVAMAVMALLLVLMLQVTNGVLLSSRTQNQQMESGGAARRALDVMALDCQNAVTAGNSAILAGQAGASYLLVLPVRRLTPSGVAVANQRFLAVAYATNASNQLLRSYVSIPFTESNPVANLPGYTFTNNGPLSPGILAFQILALGDGTNSYPLSTAVSPNWATTNYNGLAPAANYFALLTPSSTFASTNYASGLTNCTRGLQVWIAAVDDKNYRLLSNAGKLTTAQSALSSTNPTIWRASIDAANIPAQTKSSIRILTKTIPLP